MKWPNRSEPSALHLQSLVLSVSISSDGAGFLCTVLKTTASENQLPCPVLHAPSLGLTVWRFNGQRRSAGDALTNEATAPFNQLVKWINARP